MKRSYQSRNLRFILSGKRHNLCMSETPTSTQRVGIVVFDEVEVLDCCGPFEVFSVANRLRNHQDQPAPFEVMLIGTGSSVKARGGLELQTHRTLDNSGELDILLVAGGVTTAAEQEPQLLQWLRRQDQTSGITASVCTGVFLLAQSGLVREHRVTTHWEDQMELKNRWPDLDVISSGRWVQDGKIYTSAGISAGLDLSLHLVEECFGTELAVATARQMDYAWARDN